jgi:hypothetical protein
MNRDGKSYITFILPVVVEPTSLSLYHSWYYDFECQVHPTDFLIWVKDELRAVEMSVLKKIKKGTRTYKMVLHIPAAYHRLVCQLVTEIKHGVENDSYECHRRMVYARKVLDAFGEELEPLKGLSKAEMVGFRSVVLTPILQRQLWGFHDAYTPFVRDAVRRKQAQLTIAAATEFYLKDDPTDPAYIPYYRRSLLSVPLARWHLGYIMENYSHQYYNRVQENHDRILATLRVHGFQAYDHMSIPLLAAIEVEAISDEGLTLYFKPELAKLVRCIHLHRLQLSHD